MNSPITLLVPWIRETFPVSARRLQTDPLPMAPAAALCAALQACLPDDRFLVVTAGPIETETLAADWHTLCPDSVPLILEPPQDHDTPFSPEAFSRHCAALRQLTGRPQAHGASPVVLTCIQALMGSHPNPEAQDRRTFHLAPGMAVERTDLLQQLTDAGYRRDNDVYRPGVFAVRGGIVDLWPIDASHPFRMECFGPEIETLRTFDPATQRSQAICTTVRIPPATLVSVPEIPAQFFPVQQLTHGFRIIWIDPAAVAAQADHFRLAASGMPILDRPAVTRALLAARPALELFVGDPAPPGIPRWDPALRPLDGLADTGAGGLPPDVLATRRAQRLRTLWAASRSRPVRVFVDTPGIRDHLRAELAALPSRNPPGLPEAVNASADGRPPSPPPEGETGPDAVGLILEQGTLSAGFVSPVLIVVAQSDLYGRRASARRRVSPHENVRGAALESAEFIRPGERVVHVEHGIGQFAGLTEITVGDSRTEVMTIEYAEGMRLHVPVSQAHLLSRYVGSGHGPVKLHHLGGKRWRRERIHAESAVADLAAALLETQAQRSTIPGFAFDPAPPWMAAFEHAFPHPETPDQSQAIADIKADMAAARPMDRLLCGDAGYGKTEVALRAAFIAVMQGKQVAVLAPTTVLVEQHYETFRERMAPYPIRIDVLSRFRTAAHRRRTLRDLADGRVDILIGAHALLAPGVVFHDLALVIIDEEQRFGVQQKEQLKSLRRLVDVLTLTATPIPRTLYLSMTGARDLSLLQTPPRDRLAVEIRVAEDRDTVIRDALRRELRREGQSFVLYNRVATIERMRQRLERLVPEARIAVAHGQMPPRELAAVMQAFARGDHDILLCTTLVESGLDIPRANTILIHRADRFGIADLYQLRGRVGRADLRAYAWLLLPAGGHLEGEARERIRALQRHGGLGGGFDLAVRDLEIRGAGNLLGADQSGHIAAIGFGLYCQLLQRSIARLQGKTPPPLIDVALRLDFLDLSPGAPAEHGAALPYGYIEDETQRITLHRRLAQATRLHDLRDLRQTLRDRFGPIPPPARRWLQLGELRIVAAARGIERLECRNGQIRLYRTGMPILPERPAPTLSNNDAVDRNLSVILRFVRGIAKASHTGS